MFHNYPVFRDGLGDDPEDLDTYANDRLIELKPIEILQESTKNQLVEQTYKEIFPVFEVENVKDFLKTEKNKAYFWTGMGSFSKPNGMADKEYQSFQSDFSDASEVNNCVKHNLNADEIARKNGGETIEMKLDNIADILIKNGFPHDRETGTLICDQNNPAHVKAWDDVLRSFTEQASGEVHVWCETDMEIDVSAFKDNSKITSISVINVFSEEKTPCDSENDKKG